MYIRLTCMYSSCRSCRPHPVEMFWSWRITPRRYISHPGDKYLDDTNPHKFLLSATLSFEQYTSSIHVSYQVYAKTCESIEDYYFRLLGIAYDSVYSEICFWLKPEVQGCYRRISLFSKCAFALDFIPPTSRMRTLYIICNESAGTAWKTWMS